MLPRNFNYGPDASVSVLMDVVARVSYKPGWTFNLTEIDRGQGCGGLTLLIGAEVPNSLDPSESVNVLHLMPVLPAAYDEESWVRWVFEQIELVERHESMEFFQIDGDAPYFSEHRPGANPYALRLVKSPEQRDEPAVPWVGGPPEFEPEARA